ncbi:hypothetical protein RJ639_035252 [Escallonia herrerae]|uniref:Uncharacterized protein n=1 Tax=Escallonia herrerae TaxID=1293975 RepID=A0AA88WP31_9ASTE|nr:hypothetical protein RJ639_035252 [Escallonia herrerae]
MPEQRSYDRMKEVRQVDNLFWHLERYFEAIDIDDEKREGPDGGHRHRYSDDQPLTAKPEGELLLIREGVLGSGDVERQQLCFFIDGLQQWVTTELRQRKPYHLASAMAIIERLEDFKQCDRSRSPRHERAKDEGDGMHYGKDCPHKGKIIGILEKHKSSNGDSSSSDEEARIGALQTEEPAKRKKSKKRWGLLYPKVDVAEKTKEELVDTGATHNFMSPWVAEWLWLKSTKDGSWFTTVNAEERPTKGVIKNVDLRIGIWIGKVDFNIIDMDELGVVLKMDFLKKSSATLNPYCGVMMMAGKEGQSEWMISLVSKDGADAGKGITVLQLDKGSMLCYGERQMGPMTYTADMLTKMVATEKFKHCLSLIHLLFC